MSTDKTALQTLIEKLRVMMGDLPSDSSRALGLATAADLATDLKEIEKQQIIDAVWWGHDNKPEMIHPPETFGSDYYNKTYKH